MNEDPQRRAVTFGCAAFVLSIRSAGQRHKTIAIQRSRSNWKIPTNMQPTVSKETYSGADEEGLTGADRAESQSKAQDPHAEVKSAADQKGVTNSNLDAVVKSIIGSGKLSQEETKAIRDLLNDYTALKTKIDRLKGLLGRSAKAQREAAVELKCSQKKLDQALRDIKRLNDKVDHLSSRPTHSE